MDRIKLQEYYPSELEIKKIENSTDRVEIFMKTTDSVEKLKKRRICKFFRCNFAILSAKGYSYPVLNGTSF